MTWRYSQSSGEVLHDLEEVGVGYSGFEAGKNNPAMQEDIGIGPIPVGYYRIGNPYDSETHGPHVMSLTPLAATETFGRSGFLIHGDALSHPGAASHGCIVVSRPIRDQISAGLEQDNLLEVVA